MKHANFQLISSLKEALKTATLKDTGIVFIGNIVSSALGALFFFLLAHRGGPHAFGVFGVSIAVAITAVDLFDVAIDNAVISFGSKSESRGAVLRSGLLRKTLLSFVAVFLLWIFSPIVVLLLGRPEILDTVRMAVWLIPAKSFYGFVKTAFQITLKFHYDAGIEIFTSLVRLFAFSLIFVVNIPVLTLALWAYVGSLVISVLISLPVIIPILREKSLKQGHQGFTTYQLWMLLSFATSSISSRLDVFFLARLTSLEVVGWYQAAFRLFLPIQELASSLSRVFAPRFGSFSSKIQAAAYLKKTALLSGGLALSMFVLVPLFPFLIPVLYGQQFNQSVNIAYGLVVYFAVFLFSTPWWSRLLYYHSDAMRFAMLSIMQLIFLSFLLPSCILLFGGIGAVTALTVSILLATGVIAFEKK